MCITLSSDPQIKSKKEIVNTFCLGTDFDGFIDPVNEYPTVLDFGKLAKDLIASSSILYSAKHNLHAFHFASHLLWLHLKRVDRD